MKKIIINQAALMYGDFHSRTVNFVYHKELSWLDERLPNIPAGPTKQILVCRPVKERLYQYNKSELLEFTTEIKAECKPEMKMPNVLIMQFYAFGREATDVFEYKRPGGLPAIIRQMKQNINPEIIPHKAIYCLVEKIYLNLKPGEERSQFGLLHPDGSEYLQKNLQENLQSDL